MFLITQKLFFCQLLNIVSLSPLLVATYFQYTGVDLLIEVGCKGELPACVESILEEEDTDFSFQEIFKKKIAAFQLLFVTSDGASLPSSCCLTTRFS